MKYFSLAMSLLYIAVALLLLFTDAMSERIASFRVPLGLVLLAYGAMRGWIWWRKFGPNGTEA